MNATTKAMRSALVIDDHPMMADALVMALDSARVFDAIDVVCSLAAARARLDSGSEYALTLLDLHLSDATGVEGVRAMREQYPDLPIVIFSAENSVDTIMRAFEFGVRGYITKDSPRDVVISAVNLVLAGDNYIPRHAAPGLGLALGVAAPIDEGQRRGTSVNLSPRQREVLHYLLLGMPNKVIGTRLGIAQGTVKAHLHSVFAALNARNRVHAILRARELGLAMDDGWHQAEASPSSSG